MSSFRLVTSTTAANPIEHDLYLDDSGQLEWIGGDIDDLPDYGLMVAQRLKCRMLQVRGEWYQDQRTGTPYEQRLWRKGATEETVRRIFTQVAEGTPGVRQVIGLEVEIDKAARTATITDFEIVTETNQIVTASALDEPFIVRLPEGPLYG